MLIDFKLDGKTVLVVGGGTEAHRKIQSFLDSGAMIWVISKSFSSGIEKLGEEKKLSLLTTEIKNATSFVDSLNPKPDILLAATNDSKLNLELVKAAKGWGCMVYAVDNPVMSDFILPAVARIGDVKVAISTGGRSPAMAHVLRERIEKLVTPQDLLEIELQANIRGILKEHISNAKERGKTLYEILNNDNIKKALSKGNLNEAEKLAMNLIEKKEKQP
ncbi:MAG: bifunctional precorrin-2 dehydrogenase/sirohydrochlorin ferrochelatase [Candidatus Bathyarchaeota archaeon]|nr:bifunctional precorrin-2 dehydrogenase/sirohydrochlorin ferrochelatase [Candidatus Bathyarchaeota archaeon]